MAVWAKELKGDVSLKHKLMPVSTNLYWNHLPSGAEGLFSDLPSPVSSQFLH